MAVTFDAVGPSSAGTSATNVASITWTHTVAAGPCAVLVGVGCSTDASTLTATCGGVSMAAFTAKVHNNNQTAGFTQLFGLANVSTGAKTIVVSGGGGTDFEGGSLSFAGADTVTPFGTPVTSFGATAAPTGTVAGTAATSMVAGVMSNGNPITGITTGTSRFQINAFSSSAAGNAAGASLAGGGAGTITWAVTADWYGVALVEVKAGAGGGAASPVGVQAQRGGRTYRRKWDRPQQQQWPSLYVIPTATVTAGLATGSGVAAVSSFGTYIAGLASPTGASYFTDNHGAPRMWVGDEIWAMITNAGRWNSGNYQATFDAYFATRAAQGFTICYSDMFNSTFIGGATNGQNWAGQTPFTSNNPSSGLNSTYWQVIDYALNSALANGITIGLSFGGHWDWDVSGNAMFGFTGTQYQAAGNAIGTRYKNQPNLIWLIMDDYFSSFDSSLNSLLTGLRASGDTHPIAIENYAETSSRFDLPGSTSLAWGAANTQYNFGYSYSCSYLCIEYMFAEASPLTPIYGDGYFYQGGSSYDASLDRAIRQDAWWALTSGATGFNVGDEALWQWPSSAPGSVATQWYAANNTKNIRTYVEGLAGWQTLAPATGSTLITAGRGTRATQLASGGGGGQYEPAFTNAYVSASRTPDGGSGSSLAILYLPVATTITIDQTKLVTGYTATWVDPVTCATSSATVGSTYNSTAKGNNSRGAADWVLVFRAPPSTSASAGLASGSGTALNATASTVTGTNAQAGLAAGAGAALNPAAAVAPTAVLAAGAGAALSPAAISAASVTATLAAGTGTARGPAVTATASPAATLAAGAGTAQGATVTAAASPAAALATGTGAAQSPAPAVAVTAAAATGTGAALNATASTVTSGTATATLATGAGTALSPAAAITYTVTAVLPSGTGAAQSPAATATASPAAAAATGTGAALNATASTVTSGTASAGLASGAGTALNGAAAIGVNAVAATEAGAALSPAITATASPAVTAAAGTGTALNPAASTAAAPAAAPATGTGTAQGAAITVTVTAGLAAGTGAALNATASTTTAGTGAATVATGAGAALGATVAVAVTAVLASGTGTTLNASASTASSGTANAALATGTGAAAAVTAGITYTTTAVAATGTGAALGAVAASAASPAAVLAGGAGAALNPAAAIGVNAAPATGTGAAQGAAVTATASPAATVATGAGAALNATASTFTAGTANAVLATGTGTAGSATPAAGVVTPPATGTGTALNATASTAAFTNAQAGLATGTGTARNPGLTLTSTATAAPATGTGTTGSAPAAGVNAVTASAAGTGRNAVGQIGWVAPAGLATGTGAAQAPVAVLVSLAQTAAATGLGAALRATAKTVDPFTVGALTTATAGGVLTASDQRTGGPT